MPAISSVNLRLLSLYQTPPALVTHGRFPVDPRCSTLSMLNDDVDGLDRINRNSLVSSMASASTPFPWPAPYDSVCETPELHLGQLMSQALDLLGRKCLSTLVTAAQKISGLLVSKTDPYQDYEDRPNVNSDGLQPDSPLA